MILADEIVDNRRINSNKTTINRSFKYKTKIIRRILNDNNTFDT